MRARKADVMFETLAASRASSSSRFHDLDIAPEGKSLAEFNSNVSTIADYLREEDAGDRREAAVGHRQHVLEPPLHGGCRDQSRSRRLRLLRRAGEALPRRDQALGGENYVMWGGREGYETLLNTDIEARA